ncbi:hypothetical protein Patl1_36256 [Pistacia atlantica]|nr:hypothetical protein Patl1_36256 [Pistacia atlantica]
MACTRRKGEPVTSNSFMEKSSHFFKVILPSSLEEKKLGIPQMFVKKFGNELSDIATLEVPNGRVWLIRIDQRWEQNLVLIFDSTACEIHYPYSAVKSKPRCNADNSKSKPESRFVSKKERQRAIHIVRLLKPRNPSFMVFLRSHSTTERRVGVPVKFANKYLCRNSRTINLQVPDGRVLCVKIHKPTRGGFCLTEGWVKFSREENLKQGDIGIFELIKMKDSILKLSNPSPGP